MTGRSFRVPAVAVGIALAILLAPAAPAATLTWGTTGGGGSGTWNTTLTNWWTGAASTTWSNAAPDNAVLAGTAGTLTLSENMTAGTITATVTGYAISATNSSTLTVSSINISSLGQSGELTVNAQLTGNQALTLASAGNTSASGGGNGTVGINLRNTSNNFTGDVTISSGLVTYASNAVFGNAANKIILTGGGLLDNNANAALSRAIEIRSGTSTFRTYGSTNVTWTSTVTGSGAVNRTDGGTLTMSGDWSGFTGTYNNQAGTTNLTTARSGGSYNVSGGTLTLSGSSTSAGPTSISGGQLNINNATSLGTGTLTISGGTIDNTSAADITLTTTNAQSWNANVTFNGTRSLNLGTGAVTMNASRDVTVTANTLTVGGAIGGGAFNITKRGNGTLVLSGSNTFTGGVQIEAGTVEVATILDGSASNLGAGSGGSGYLGLTNSTLRYTGTSVTSTRALWFDRGTATFEITNPSTTLTWNPSGGDRFFSLTKTGSGTFQLGGALTGNAAITVNGGVLVLTAANSNTGKTSVSSGTVSIAADNGLGSAPGSFVADQLTLNNGGLRITANNVTLAANRGITLGAGGGVINSSSIAGSGITTTISGTIAGTGPLTLAATGNTSANGGGDAGLGIRLNTANTFTGDVTITTGLVSYTSDASFGNAANRIILTGGGLLDSSGGTPLSRTIVAQSGTNTFRTYGGTTVTWSSTISGAGSINRTDGGTLTLAGDLSGFSGTYTNQGGATVITGGGTVGGNYTVSASSITFNSGSNQTVPGALSGSFTKSGAGVLTLTGTDVGGNWTVNTGGGIVVSSGSAQTMNGNVSGAGTFTKAGAGQLTLGSAGTYSAPTIIQAGTLALPTGGSMGGANAITINNASTGSANTAFLIGNVTVSNAINLTNNGSGTVTIGSLVSATSTTPTFSGVLTLGRDVSLQPGTQDRTNFTNQITGTGNVTITTTGVGGNSRIVFDRGSGAANDFVGNITLASNAVFQIGVGTSIGNRTIPDSASMTLNAGSWFRIAPTGSGDSEAMGALVSSPTTSGTVEMITGSTFTLLVGGTNASGVYGGTILNSSGALSFTKVGSGTQTLAGSSSYSGATTVRAGVLVAGTGSPSGSAGAFGNTSSAIVLGDDVTGAADAPTLLIGGTFTVGRPITIGSLANAFAYTPVLGGTNTSGTATFSGAITTGTTASAYPGVVLRAAPGGTVNFSGAWTTNDKPVTVGSAGNTGTVRLSSALATGGGITVSTGTLQLGLTDAIGNVTPVTIGAATTFDLNGLADTIGSLSGSGTISGGAGSVLTVTQAANATFAGAVIGSAGLTKAGSATLTLSGISTTSGATTVNSGTLSLASGASLANSAMSVANGGSLAGSGTAGATTVLGGGLLAPGIAGSGTLSLGTLTFGTAAGNTATVSVPTTNLASIPGLLKVNGDLITNGGAGSVTFAFGNLSLVPTGTYSLISFTGSYASGTSPFAYTGSLSGRQGVSFATDTNAVNMVISNAFPIWSGSNGSGWFTANNWTLNTDGSPASFQANDTVVFNDAGAGGSVTISGSNADPITTTFSGDTVSYTLSSPDGYGISTGNLIKSGSATVTIATTNSYSGGSTVSGGTLLVTGSQGLGTGNVTVTGGTLTMNAAGASGTSAAVSLSGGTLNVDAAGGIGGGPVTVSAGTLNVNATSGVGNGAISLSGGAINVGATGGIGNGAITVTGGALTVSAAGGVGNGPVSVATGTVTVTAAGAIGTGTFTLTNGVLAVTGAGSVNSAAITNTAGTILVGNNAALGSGTLALNGGVVSSDSGSARTVSNPVAIGGNVTLGDATNNGNLTFSGRVDMGGSPRTLTAASNVTLSGSVGNGTLAKAGAGTLTLTGSAQFANTTTITAGTLQLGGAGVINGGSASADFAVSSGATLAIATSAAQAISGTISGAGALVKAGTGLLTLSAANTYSGKTTITGGTVSIAADSGLGSASGGFVADQLTLDGGALRITTANTTLSANRGITLGAGGGTIDTSSIAGAQTVTLPAVIAGTGPLTLRSTGDQSSSGGGDSGLGIRLTATNTFTGNVTITTGLVSYASDASFGNAANQIILTGGGLLNDNSGNIPLARPIVISAGTSTFRTYGSVNVSWSSTVTGGAAVNRTDGGVLTFTGTWSGFTGTYNNQVGTSVFAGPFNSGTTSVSGGQVTFSGTGTAGYTDLGSGGTIVIATGGNLTTGTFNKGGSAGGTLTVQPGATLTTTNFQNSWAFGTLTNNGTWNAPNGITLSVNASTTVAGTGTINASQFRVQNNTTATLGGGRMNLGSGGITNAGTTINLNGVTLGASADWSSSSPLVLQQTTTINTLDSVDGTTGRSISLSGALSGAGFGLTKAGAGTLTLTGANTFTGATAITGGTLALAAGTFGTGAAVSDQNAIDIGTFAGNNATFLVTGGTLGQTGSAGMRVGNSGTGTFTQSGGSVTIGSSGLWVGDGSGSRGTVTLSGGTFTTAGPTILATRSVATLTVSGSANVTLATLQLGHPITTGQTATVNLDGGRLALDQVTRANGTATFFFNSGTLAASGSSSTFMTGLTSAEIKAGGAIVDSGAFAITIGQALNANLGSPGGGLTKLGSGILTLTGSSGYTGATTVSAGTLAVGGTGSIAASSGVGIASGAAFDISNASGGVSIGTLSGSGAVALGTNTLETAIAANSTYAGGITGSGGLTKVGAGTLTLTGSNGYSGATTISGGTVALGSGGSIAASAVNLAASGATFDMTNASGNVAIGGLSGAAGSSLLLGGNSLTADIGTGSTFDGVISGAGGFTKTGAGKLELTSVQDFTGPLTISTGELEASAGANALASASSIVVAGGATLSDGGNGLTIVDGQTLAGNGTVNGDVLFDPGSILSPGGSVGTLTLGNATWSGSGSYVFDITNATLDSVTGAGLGGGWDLLDVNTLTINATTTNPYFIQLRSLTNGGDNTPGAMSGGNWDQDSDYQWLFVQAASEIGAFDQGTFVFNTTGFVSGTNGDFYVYRGDDPNVIGGSSDQLYIVYAAVPEPGTLALAGIGLAVAGWAARRRRSPRGR